MAVLLPLDRFVSEFEGRHLDLSILGQTIFLKIFYVLDWGDFIFGAINSLFDPELRFFNYDDRKI